eukprot:4559664-Pleurochrysis_carterae.AAC.1
MSRARRGGGGGVRGKGVCRTGESVRARACVRDACAWASARVRACRRARGDCVRRSNLEHGNRACEGERARGD